MPNLPQTFDLPRDIPSWENLARVWMRHWTFLTQVVNSLLKNDTYANRSATPFFDETQFYATDTGVSYIGQSGTWQVLMGWTGTVTSTATTPYTLAVTDGTVLVDATAGNKVVNVSQGAAYTGRIWCVKKVDSSGNTVTITPASGTIDGTATKVLSVQYQSRIFISDGTNYHILGQV